MESSIALQRERGPPGGPIGLTEAGGRARRFGPLTHRIIRALEQRRKVFLGHLMVLRVKVALGPATATARGRGHHRSSTSPTFCINPGGRPVIDKVRGGHRAERGTRSIPSVGAAGQALIGPRRGGSQSVR